MHIKRIDELFNSNSRERVAKGLDRLKDFVLPKHEELGNKILKAIENGNYSDVNKTEREDDIQFQFQIFGKNKSKLDIEISSVDKKLNLKANSKELKVSKKIISKILETIKEQGITAEKNIEKDRVKSEEEERLKMFKDF